MSSHLSPRCLTWCFAPLRKAGHWLGQGARAMLLPGYCVGPRVGENLPRSLPAHGLVPFSHLCGPCLQPAGQAAGAAGPPQCPALPRLRPAAPLRGWVWVGSCKSSSPHFLFLLPLGSNPPEPLLTALTSASGCNPVTVLLRVLLHPGFFGGGAGGLPGMLLLRPPLATPGPGP